MPGIVVFKRRWSVGSDDLVVPGAFLLVLHLIWIVVLAVLLGVVTFDLRVSCILTLWKHILGYLAILSASLLVELFICIVAMRGSILDTEARASMQYLLYVRLGVMVTELVWLVLGVVWLVMHYQDCPIDVAKEAILGIVICNWCVILSVLVTVWCTYDAAGGSWVKMKKYQQSMKESESRFQYKRSAGNRNWRQRKVIRAYQDSWDHRCRLLFCCMRNSDRNRNSFSDIARLLSDFFRDLDVVPSDVVAGLVLLRKFQKIEREAIVKQRKNETYEYLSGVAVTTNTQFLALSDPDVLERYQQVVYYMHFALGAYGWPMFLVSQGATGLCKLCSRLRCLCVPCGGRNDEAVVIKDNCCGCNYAALRHLTETGDVRVTYATYHVDVGETPFFVAVDVARKKVVLAIRGTLSMKDVITDLNAEGEPLPVNPPRDDWLGHKGMVLAAEYIRHKIKEESILETAFNLDPAAGTQDFGLVLVGHSLGAGTAAILAILLRPEYPSLLCFSYSPPGGSLSMSAVEYTKSFITSVVVGKDVVPRIGLHQLESLRADLINTIKRSKDPKWKTIVCSAACCGCHSVPTSAAELRGNTGHMRQYQQDKDLARDANTHPNDSSVALTVHQPLYPPGRIIHIVRHHPTATEQKYETRWRQVLSKHEPVYQAVWANNTDFDEVLISPVMIQDHMPDNVLDALNKVITLVGPAKPQRTQSLNNSAITSTEHLDSERCRLLTSAPTNLTILNSPSSPKPSTPPHKLCLETSFTSLQSPSENQNHSLDSSINSQSLPNTRTSLINTLTNLQNMPTRSRSQISHTNPNITWEYSSLMEGGVVKNVNLSSGFLKGLRRVDLIHDDWLGLAPLATPESLSEVSSNSSRAGSLVLNIDKALKGGLLGHKRSGSSNSSYDVTPARIPPQIQANNLGVDNGSTRGPFNGNIVSADKNVVSGNTSSGDTSFRSAKMSSGEIFEGSSNYESATNGNSEEDLLTVNQFSSADSITVNVDVHTNPADFVPETDGIVSSSPKTVKFAIESQDSIEDNDSPTMQMYNKMNTDSKTSGKEMNLGKICRDVGKLDEFDLRRNDNFRFPCFDEAAVSSSSSNFTSPLTDDFSSCSGNNNIVETLADQSDSLIKGDVELRKIQKDLNTNESLPLLSNIGEVHGDARKKYVITSVGKGESSV